MAFNLTSAKITGNPGVTGWAQIHEFVPEDEEKLKSRGHLYAVIATGRHEEGVDAVTAGRELLVRLHEEYFGAGEGPAFAVLQNAVKKVSEEFNRSWGEVEISAMTLVEDVVYSVAAGGAEVAIFRNGMLAKILESGKDEVISASGYPQEGDLLILGTKVFFDSFSPGVLKAAFQEKDANLAVEQLAPAAHSRENTGSLGACIISFGKKEAIFIERKKAVLAPPSDWKGFSFLIGGVSKVQDFFSKFIPEKKIYLRRQADTEEETPQRRKTMATIGIILVLLLIASIGFGIRAKQIKEEKGRYAERLAQAQHQFEEAVELASLNPERARELFSSSSQIAEELKKEGVKDEVLDQLLEKLAEDKGRILGEYQVNPELFVDLSLQISGFEGQDMASSGETIFVLDKNGKRIIKTSFATKKTSVFAGPDEVGDALAITAYEDRAFVLTADGIYETGEAKSRLIEKEWKGDILIYAYAGNLYILDKEASTIKRYVGGDSSFSSGQNWLALGIKVDLSKIKGMTIDGSIILLSESGRISKFLLGNQTGFTPQGVYPELGPADAIYTNEGLKGIYILEKTKGRIVVLDKEGKYLAQYRSDSLKDAQDLVVSEKEGKIIFLLGSKLNTFKISHQ